MVHLISLGVLLASLWLLLSGIYEPLLLSLGAASCVIVLLIANRMDVVDHEAVPVQMRIGVVAYWIWLTREIAKANLHVARLIVDPALPIGPRMIRVKATQRSDVGVVTHANSITLTPGTVSIEIERDEILVHAISEEAAQGTLEGAIDRRVTAVEER